MSKRAEEAALKYAGFEKFPTNQDSLERREDVDTFCSFLDGYEQAEKDLALTWEDVATIITIYENGVDNGDYRRYNEAEWMKEYSQDILRRFNEMKTPKI